MSHDPQDNDKQEKIAVALKYEREKEPAPKVIAKGRGELAETIIATAKEAGVEIHKDEALSEVLLALDIDTIIPLEAYAAVAEVLSYVYNKNSDYKKQKK